MTPADAEPNALLVNELERLLCSPEMAGSMNTLLPRVPDAWSVHFPGLDTLVGRADGHRRIRICIATEQIVGPVRNGGIGTTYAALANLLAEAGFDITVLYLRGTQVETETIDHWIDHYRIKGVKLVPVPDYATRDGFQSSADRWLHAPYNMMKYLIDHPMDVVHVSEWRGSGYLSLLAKRQGLAFADTLFVVKTSSPWMWNRLYGAHVIEKAEDIIKIQAERCSVELADVVIGGSRHLLRWMASQGYAVPRERAFVQPNVATFTALEPLMRSRALARGARTPVNEIVFFGRLEARKGLFLFCQAIRRLIRKGVPLPPKITFVGKPGARMASHPDEDAPDYINAVARDWPTEVTILTSFQQFDAIEYLLGGARLAVMPSIIENSSMAIYEAAACGIPCVATDVGGNAELIEQADHAAVLCQPHPVSLGDKLEEALALGGMVPRPSFDNDANLETWRRFHRQLGGDLHGELLRRPLSAPGSALGPALGISVCIYYTGDAAALLRTLASLAVQQQPPGEVLVAVDAENSDASADASALLARFDLPATVVDAFDLDAGLAFNTAAGRTTGSHLLFLWEGATLEVSALATLERIVTTNGAAVLTYLHRIVADTDQDTARPELRAVIIGGASNSYFRNDVRELPLFVRRDAFRELGGFTTDYRVVGYDHEFVAKAQLAGLSCETAMVDLGTIAKRSAESMRLRGYDLSASGFRATRPHLAATPLAERDLLLFARGLHLRGVPAANKAKPSENTVKTAEGVLVRMIAGLTNEAPVEPILEKRPSPDRSAKPAQTPRPKRRKAGEGVSQ